MKEEFKSLGALATCKDEEDNRDKPFTIGSTAVESKRDTIQ